MSHFDHVTLVVSARCLSYLGSAITLSQTSKVQRHNAQKARLEKLSHCIARDEGRYEGRGRANDGGGWRKMTVLSH